MLFNGPIHTAYSIPIEFANCFQFYGTEYRDRINHIYCICCCQRRQLFLSITGYDNSYVEYNFYTI